MTLLERMRMIAAPEGDAGGAGGAGGGGGGSGDGKGGSASPPGGDGKGGEGAKDGAGAGGGQGGAGGDRKAAISAGDGKDGKNDTGAKDGQGKPVKAGADDYVVTVPESWKGTYDKVQLESYTRFAKENGLSAEQASKALGYYAQQQAAEQANWDKQDEAWYGELEKDTEFGGAKLAQSQANVQKALRAFDPSGELLKGLQQMKLDNWPPLARLLARVGAAGAEDKSATEKAKGAGAKPSAAQRRASFYDDMKPGEKKE